MWNIILDFDGRFWCTDVSSPRGGHRGQRSYLSAPGAGSWFIGSGTFGGGSGALVLIGHYSDFSSTQSNKLQDLRE